MFRFARSFPEVKAAKKALRVISPGNRGSALDLRTNFQSSRSASCYLQPMDQRDTSGK